MRIESRVRLSATRDAFQFSAELEAFEGDQPFAQRELAASRSRASWCEAARPCAVRATMSYMK